MVGYEGKMCSGYHKNMSRQQKMKKLQGKGQTAEQNCSFTFGTFSV
jgi:hypothetical protein